MYLVCRLLLEKKNVVLLCLSTFRIAQTQSATLFPYTTLFRSNYLPRGVPRRTNPTAQAAARRVNQKTTSGLGWWEGSCWFSSRNRFALRSALLGYFEIGRAHV